MLFFNLNYNFQQPKKHPGQLTKNSEGHCAIFK